MVKQFIFVVFCCTALTIHAQVLRDLNFAYLYDSENAFSLTWDVSREQGSYTAFYDLQIIDVAVVSDLKIQWETRKSTSEKTGVPLTNEVTQLDNQTNHKSGYIKFSPQSDHSLLVLTIQYTQAGKAHTRYFYKNLANSKGLFAESNHLMLTNDFTTQQKPVQFKGFTNTLQVSYYKNMFPPAAPAFSTAQARVSKTIKPDSIFYVNATTEVSFTQKGLYLVQQDTASAQGVAFRVEDDYPKLGKLESLAGPLVYVCTKQEYEKIKAAGNDKKKFDQLILSITGNTERARIFMRNYFRRVEAANQYFSSYKEGWKTDRGMIYIIYGPPDEVYLFEGREVWEYKNDYLKERFQFVKSATIFDPENFVLIREKGFTDDWYSMIDLWRKARF